MNLQADTHARGAPNEGEHRMKMKEETRFLLMRAWEYQGQMLEFRKEA